jgi:hypothetical protein
MLPEIVYRSLYTEAQAHHKEMYLPITVTLSTGITLTIPAGFRTDLATVPRIFWGIVSPSGRHDLAVIVHDYLLTEGWARSKADKELLHFLRLTRVHPLKSYTMYSLVRAYSLYHYLKT